MNLFRVTLSLSILGPCFASVMILPAVPKVRYNQILVNASFRNIWDTSFHDCVVECGRRSTCDSGNHFRLVGLCQLNTELGKSTSFNERDGAVYFKLTDDVRETVKTRVCQELLCQKGQRCGVQESDAVCKLEECSEYPLTSNNLTDRDGVNYIGTRRQVTCPSNREGGLDTIAVSVCQSNGTWSPLPDPCPDITMATTPSIHSTSTSIPTTTSTQTTSVDSVVTPASTSTSIRSKTSSATPTVTTSTPKTTSSNALPSSVTPIVTTSASTQTTINSASTSTSRSTPSSTLTSTSSPISTSTASMSTASPISTSTLSPTSTSTSSLTSTSTSSPTSTSMSSPTSTISPTPISTTTSTISNTRTATSSTAVCEDGWTHFENCCYLVFNDYATNWDEAKKLCESLGARLVQIRNEGDLLFLKDILDADQSNVGQLQAGKTATYWTSGKYLDLAVSSSSGWYWYGNHGEDNPVEFFKWYDDTQQYEGDQSIGMCLVLEKMVVSYASSDTDWFYTVALCEEAIDRALICQREKTTSTTTTATTTTMPTTTQQQELYSCDVEWLVYEDMCYRVIEETSPWEQAQTDGDDSSAQVGEGLFQWQQAQEMCGAYDSTLASLYNDGQLSFVRDLLNNRQPQQQSNTGPSYWIGGQFHEDSWLWMNGVDIGTPINYFKWVDESDPEHYEARAQQNKCLCLENPGWLDWHYVSTSCNDAIRRYLLCEKPAKLETNDQTQLGILGQ